MTNHRYFIIFFFFRYVHAIARCIVLFTVLFHRKIVDSTSTPWDTFFAPGSFPTVGWYRPSSLLFFSGCLQRVGLRAGWWDTRTESSFVPMLNRGGRRKNILIAIQPPDFFSWPCRSPLSVSFLLLYSISPRYEFYPCEQPSCGKIYSW